VYFQSKVVVQAHTVYESIQYRLEDEAFDSIADLITCYVTSNKSVTIATGAKITTPINRALALSTYGTIRSSALNGSSNNLYSGGRINTPIDYSTLSLPRLSAQDRYQLRRRPSDPSIHPPVEEAEPPAIPDKPSRVPSTLYPSTEEIRTNDDSNGSQIPLPELPERPLTLPRLRKDSKGSPQPVTGENGPPLPSRKSCDLDVEATFAHQQIPEGRTNPTAIQQGSFHRDFPTLFQLDSFQVSSAPCVLCSAIKTAPKGFRLMIDWYLQTILLPVGNFKPLEGKTFEAVLQLFEDHSIKSMALHMLHSDLDVLGGLHHAEGNNPSPYKSHYANRGITSGIELCTLPNGQQLRSDLMQRYWSKNPE